MGLFTFLTGDGKNADNKLRNVNQSPEEIRAQKLVSNVVECRKRFYKHNDKKLQHCHEVLSPDCSAIFDLLPFLIHTNIDGFPGTIPLERLPTGIASYEFNPTIVNEAIMRLFRKMPCTQDFVKNYVAEKTDIDSLSLIGSIGSISQSEKSDLDFWLCLEKNKFQGDQLEILQEKLTEIEKWTMETADLEVHFFITDIQGVREENFGESDEESSGSAQAKILKEEYFRTVTMIAGKLPFWCAVPPCDNRTYQEYLNAVTNSSLVSIADFVDFGNTPEISFDEFLGASLWQMNKALGSPFKSVIKMALLDTYTDSAKKNVLLCDTVKTAIQKMKYNPKHIDPYVVLFERTQNHYRHKVRTRALLLLQKCIYLKSGTSVHPNDLVEGKELPPNKQVMVNYLREWRWADKDILFYNDFKNWNFQAMKLINDEVNNYLIETYKALSDKLKEKKDLKVRIDPKDLAVLGRKLYTFYAKKPNKVECTSKFMDKNFVQENLTFYQPDIATLGSWKIYLGHKVKHNILNETEEDSLVKVGDDIIEICIWLVQNKLFSSNTRVTAISKSSITTIDELRGLLSEIEHFIPPLDINCLKKEDLLVKARPKNILIIINFTSPNWVREIKDVHLIIRNTWGEVFTHRMSGNNGIKAAIEQIKLCKPYGRAEILQTYKIFVADKVTRRDIEERLNRLFKSHISYHIGKTMFYQHKP